MKLKSILFALLLPLVSFSQTYTNGTICSTIPITYNVITAHNGTTTNTLDLGDSLMTGNTIFEFYAIDRTILFLSGGTEIIADKDSVFSIDIFEQTILNPTDKSKRVKFGDYNLALTLKLGAFVILTKTNETSAISISAEDSAFELNGGLFVFEVSSNNVTYSSNGKFKTAVKGSIPIVEHLSTLLITKYKKVMELELSDQQFKKYNSLSTELLNSSNDVQFFIVRGKITGIYFK